MAETYIPPMTESKAAADKRLHAEGRWGKFAAHRLSLVRRLKKERGGTKGEVNDDAWALALASFPPLKVGDGCETSPSSSSREQRPPKDAGAGSYPASESAVGCTGNTEPESASSQGDRGVPDSHFVSVQLPENVAIFQESGKTETTANSVPAAGVFPPEPEDPYEGELPPAAASSADLSRDILWVYQNLEKRFVRDLPPAPSGGAISLWRWAKANRNKFFADVLPKAARAADQTDEEKGAAAGDRAQVEAIGGMLGKLRGEIEERALLFCVNCGGKLGRAQ